MRNYSAGKMYIKLRSAAILILLFSTLICFISSCAVGKKTVYFRNVPDSVAEMGLTSFVDPIIQPDDILSINIETIDPKAAAAVSQLPVMPAVGANSASAVGGQEISGFAVDKEGNVEIPILGAIHVAGLTTYQTRELIKGKAARYFVNPTVQVRFVNFRITVLGEVARPATYTLPNEKITLLDAIGLAGDLTIYGKRNNIMLIREEAGKKKTVRFDLNSSDVFRSPYFYLRQNDVIYVEPNRSKTAANNVARTQAISIIGAVVSVAIVALSRL